MLYMAQKRSQDVKRKGRRKEGAQESWMNVESAALICTIGKVRKKNMNFTVKQLTEATGISQLASRKMFSRYLNEHNYKYMQTRKKGLLTTKDRLIRFVACPKNETKITRTSRVLDPRCGFLLRWGVFYS